MGKTIFPVQLEAKTDALFGDELLDSDVTDVADQISVSRESPTKLPKYGGERVLDQFLLVTKWALIYLPGVILVYLAMMITSLMLFYGEYEFLTPLGILTAGTFLIIFGLGKVSKMKYLKSVMVILVASAMLAIVHLVLMVLFQREFLGMHWILSVPFIAFLGYLSKRTLDKREEN